MKEHLKKLSMTFNIKGYKWSHFFFIKIHFLLDIFFVWNLILSKFCMNAIIIKTQQIFLYKKFDLIEDHFIKFCLKCFVIFKIFLTNKFLPLWKLCFRSYRQILSLFFSGWINWPNRAVIFITWLQSPSTSATSLYVSSPTI